MSDQQNHNPDANEAFVAPEYPYEPANVSDLDLRVALIGCGAIARNSHLPAYDAAGIDVVAFCDIDGERARKARDSFDPEGDVYTDAADVYAREDVDVVDIATHPEPREALIEDALNAGKHVLSQKPFVIDLDAGERLVTLAREQGVKLAVNQNGRWSPHFSYARHAVADGLLGDLMGAHLAVHKDFHWVADSGFDDIPHLVLYDYAIHWFDMVACLFRGREPRRVYASTAHSPSQQATPPLLGQAVIEYEGAQVSLIVDGNVRHGMKAENYIAGTEGTIETSGPDIGDQTVTVHTNGGTARPKLVGGWSMNGFQGPMAELLESVKEDHEPSNSGADNLRSLELCFAAVASAEDGEPKTPGEERRPPL